MQSNNLRAAARDWSLLRKHAATSFHLGAAEAGAIGLLGSTEGRTRNEFLLAALLLPQKGDIKTAGTQSFVFSPTYLRRAHLEMRRRGLAGIAIFHTHPLSDTTVGFSKYDDAEEPRLIANLQDIEPSTNIVSVVLGKNSQCGRVWRPGGLRQPLSKLVLVGETIIEASLNGISFASVPHPSEVFSRAEAITGRGALSRLSGMVIGVVGASGTGSIVCELLARAGVKKIILIDPDISKKVNLNRILYMTDQDAARGVPKVDVLKRGIESLGLGCELVAIQGNVLDRQILAKLREADVIFGCVDAAMPRDLLARFAFQYLRPYIDVGSEIGGDDDGIVSANARTSYVAPGRFCLQCTGVVTSRELRHESLTWGERERVVSQGYSKDLILNKPAVMDLNMHAAATGMMVLRHLLQPFMVIPLPVAISENLVTYRTIAVSEARSASAECPVCQKNQWSGFGDSGAALGYSEAEILAMIEPVKRIST